MSMISAPLYGVALLAGMLLLLELGRRMGRRQLADSGVVPAGFSAIDGAILALLGLLIAFTFSGAASRFETRRELIVEEANDIGTAWLRLDLLPAQAREPLRDLFRSYLDSRLHVYATVGDAEATRSALARNADLQAEIWRRSVAACERPDGQRAIVVLLPALNGMFDVTTTRTMATRFHQPEIIFALLVGLGLICALLAGYSSGQGGQRSWVHLIGFAAVITLTVYVIVDLEYPRRGLIRVDASDEVLRELRTSMN